MCFHSREFMCVNSVTSCAACATVSDLDCRLDAKVLRFTSQARVTNHLDPLDVLSFTTSTPRIIFAQPP